MTISLLGFAWDASSSHARGAALGPSVIRAVLGSDISNDYSISGVDTRAVIDERVFPELPEDAAQARDQITKAIAAALATALALPADVGLQVLRRPEVNLRANLLGFAVTVIVAGAAVGTWGVLGIAYGWLAGCLLASAWRLVGFVRISAAAEGGAA